MEFKKLGDMTSEERANLPTAAVRVIRVLNKDRKSSKVTSVRYEAQVVIHSLLVKRTNITQAQFGLLAVGSGKPSANEFVLTAPIHYTKGERKDKEKYFLYEARLSADVIIRDFLSPDEAKLLSTLKTRGEFKSDFQERPINDIPEIDNIEDVVNL